MKNRNFITSQIIIGVVALLLLWLMLRGVSWSAVLDTFRSISLGWIVAIILVTALVHVLTTARWWFLLWGFDHKLPFAPMLRYRLTIYSISYIVPGPQLGGEVLQVYYPTRHGVPSATSIAAMSLDKALEFLGNFTFIVVGVIVMLLGQRIISGADLWVMVTASSLMLIPMIMLVFVARGRHPISAIPLGLRRIVPASWRSWLRRTFPSLPNLEGLHETFFHSEELMAWLWRHRLSSILMATFLTVVLMVLVAVDFWMIAASIGLDLTKTQTIGTMVMVYFAYLLPVPAGLGAMEAAIILAFNTFGYTREQALSVGLIMRLRDLALTALGIFVGGFDSVRSAIEVPATETLLGDAGGMSVADAEEIITATSPTAPVPAASAVAPSAIVVSSAYTNGRDENGALASVGATAIPSVVSTQDTRRASDSKRRES